MIVVAFLTLVEFEILPKALLNGKSKQIPQSTIASSVKVAPAKKVVSSPNPTPQQATARKSVPRQAAHEKSRPADAKGQGNGILLSNTRKAIQQAEISAEYGDELPEHQIFYGEYDKRRMQGPHITGVPVTYRHASMDMELYRWVFDNSSLFDVHEAQLPKVLPPTKSQSDLTPLIPYPPFTHTIHAARVLV
jgi:hypothetical protein